MNWRLLAVAVGLAGAGFGLAIAFVPSLNAGLSVPGNTPTLLAIVAAAVGLRRLRSFLGHDASDYRPPVREPGPELAAPGDEFDDLLRRVSGASVAGNPTALKAKQDLRDVVVEYLVMYHGCSEAEAEGLVDRGEWTDDELAARFLATNAGLGSNLRETVGMTLGRRKPFHRRVRHVTQELYELSGGDRE